VEKIVKKHPLWERLEGIKGFTAYQLALIMAYTKDISKFDTPSKYVVYAGIGVINGMPITKANLNKIKEYYSSQGKEFKGFHTVFAGRMLGVVADCLIRPKGFFYNMYLNIRKRLVERCINGGEVVEQEKEVKGKDGVVRKEKRYYMKNKKNQSLEAFTHSNAKRRIVRTLLHLIWTEWRTLRELPVRNPYPHDYLGHTSLITLEEVKAYDSKNGKDTSDEDVDLSKYKDDDESGDE
jgi:hypothetical protein